MGTERFLTQLLGQTTTSMYNRARPSLPKSTSTPLMGAAGQGARTAADYFADLVC